MSDFLLLSICLSDIPKDKIKRADNGNAYVNLICSRRKEPDAYGNTHFIAISSTKEERESGAEKIYCGSAKQYNPQPQPVTPESIDDMPPIGDDDDQLPF